LKLYYYLFILLVYIDRKFPLFIPSKDTILIQNKQTSLYEKKTGSLTSVGYKFYLWTSTWR